jgi:outer membrane protein OmpA-like peptidoglycan-associated protein
VFSPLSFILNTQKSGTMSFNLLHSVKNLFDNHFISEASVILEEDSTRIQKGVSAIIPSVLTGIMNKAGSGDAYEILQLSKETTDSRVFSSPSNFLNSNHLMARGADYIKSIFGNRMSEVVNAISSFAGLKSSSVSSLLSFAAPAALASLGRHVENNNMETTDLLTFLIAQKDSILEAVPPGFNLGAALGLFSLSSIGTRLSDEYSTLTGHTNFAKETVQRKSGSRWVLTTILVIAGLGLLWYLLSGRKNNNTEAVSTVMGKDTVVATLATIAAPQAVHESIKVVLPNGEELNAYKGGIEDQLVTFLKDPNAKAGKNTWFDFDNLNFETGSAVITPESMTQLQNIADILKAFPNTSVKIGGYTDKTGDEPANMKLSQARANAVVAALKQDGVNTLQILGAEGYGSQFATVPSTASDEERRTDRRIAVSPRKK